ncbi:hypothetical protein [Helicobacter sp. T3_23-1056]
MAKYINHYHAHLLKNLNHCHAHLPKPRGNPNTIICHTKFFTKT